MSINEIKINNIDRIIAHEIHPKTPETDAYAVVKENLLLFQNSEKEILVNRLYDALKNSKKTFKLSFEDKSEDSIYQFLSNFDNISENEFIEYSKKLADDLADAHFRVKIPGGYCLVCDGTTRGGERFFLIIKAELQEVFSINQNHLQLIKDVFLSPAKDFYKIGFFLQNSSGHYNAYMYDDQFSLQKKDLTEYFYGQFLGLTTDTNEKLKNKNFFNDTKNFIENNVDNLSDRLGLLKALTVQFRENTSGVVSPKQFSEDHFEGELKEKYDKIIDKKYPQSFTVNTKLIDKGLKLNRISIPLSYTLAIVGDSNALGTVDIIDNPNDETLENLEPEINSRRIKKFAHPQNRVK